MHIFSHGGANPFHSGRFGGHHGGGIEHYHRGHGHGRGMGRGASEVDVTRSNQRLETVATDGNAAQRVVAEGSSLSIEKSGFDSRRDFVHTAKKMVRQAVKGMARDVGRAFESMGLDGDAAKKLVKGFIKPMVQALRSGADFTAQLKMAAVQKTTVVSGNEISESLSLVAKSVDISVNHDTGEISVDVKNVKIEQESTASLEAPAVEAPALLGPPDSAPAGEGDDDDSQPAVPGLAEIIDRVLQSAKAAGKDDDDEGESVPGPDAETAGPVTFSPAIEVLLPNADAGDEGASRLEAIRSRIRIDSAQRFRNEAGELISRLRVDARISLARVLEAEPKSVFELAGAQLDITRALDIRA